MSRMVPCCSWKKRASATGSMPGAGMNVPMRYTINAPSKKNSRCRSSAKRVISPNADRDAAVARFAWPRRSWSFLVEYCRAEMPTYSDRDRFDLAAGAFDSSACALRQACTPLTVTALPISPGGRRCARAAPAPAPGWLPSVTARVNDVSIELLQLRQTHFGDGRSDLRAEAASSAAGAESASGRLRSRPCGSRPYERADPSRRDRRSCPGRRKRRDPRAGAIFLLPGAGEIALRRMFISPSASSTFSR